MAKPAIETPPTDSRPRSLTKTMPVFKAHPSPSKEVMQKPRKIKQVHQVDEEDDVQINLHTDNKNKDTREDKTIETINELQ